MKNYKIYKSYVDQIIEINDEKFVCVDDDRNTVIIRRFDKTDFADGFQYIQRHNLCNYESFNCIEIEKSKITACYSEWTETYSYFGNMIVRCEDCDEKVRVETFGKPKEYVKEFTEEEYMIDRGTEHPPVESTRYYTFVDKNDARLRRDVTEQHRVDFEIEKHICVTDDDAFDEMITYYAEKICASVSKHDNLYHLMMGCYGYSFANGRLSTDIDIVFEKIIPLAYKLCKSGERYAGEHFCRDLMTAIINGYRRLKQDDELYLVNGKKIYLSKEYRYYMCIQFHLKLIEMHKAGVTPYKKCELDTVMHWLQSRYCEYIDNHNPVIWKDNIICQDIGEYVQAIRGKLQYFERFHKE